MAKVEEKNYWFRAKRYGWGWGLPQRWQGWLVFGIFALIWLTALAWLLPSDIDDEPAARDGIIFAVVLIADVAALVYFSFKYGEPPKWRWGDVKKIVSKSSGKK